MTPFRVNWTLKTPLCLAERPTHLDALLAFVSVEEGLQAGMDSPTAKMEENNLPLERVHAPDGEWVWKSSQLLIRGKSSSILIPMIRRTSIDEMAAARGKLFESSANKISLGSGQFRNFNFRVPVQWIEEIVAYGVGDIKAVEAKLRKLSHIGRLRRNDWGRIDSVSIIEDPAALDRWRYRVLPESLEQYATADHLPGSGTWRVPYWDRTQSGDILEWQGIADPKQSFSMQ